MSRGGTETLLLLLGEVRGHQDSQIRIGFCRVLLLPHRDSTEEERG